MVALSLWLSEEYVDFMSSFIAIAYSYMHVRNTATVLIKAIQRHR